MTYKFILVSEKSKTPKCPGCWMGRLAYDKSSKLWICCKAGGGPMWCGRKFKREKED